MVDCETKEITIQDENYLYIKVSKVDSYSVRKEIELITRRKNDKTNDMVTKVKELIKL